MVVLPQWREDSRAEVPSPHPEPKLKWILRGRNISPCFFQKLNYQMFNVTAERKKEECVCGGVAQRESSDWWRWQLYSIWPWFGKSSSSGYHGFQWTLIPTMWSSFYIWETKVQRDQVTILSSSSWKWQSQNLNPYLSDSVAWSHGASE